MIFTIIKKELKVFFRSPMAYIMMGLFCLIIGWIFFNQLIYFTENVQKMPAHLRTHYDFINEVVVKMFGNINFLLLFFIPILTMSSFAQEFKDETIYIYFSGRVSDYELIVAKYLSYVIKGGIVISTAFTFPLFLGNINLGDISFLISGSIGVFLNLTAYVAVGILASSLTSNQIIAALTGFVLIFSLWGIAMLAQSTTNFALSNLLKSLSINHHFQNFAKGRISLSDFSYYISFLTLTFLVIKKRLDMRHWI